MLNHLPVHNKKPFLLQKAIITVGSVNILHLKTRGKSTKSSMIDNLIGAIDKRTEWGGMKRYM